MELHSQHWLVIKNEKLRSGYKLLDSAVPGHANGSQ
jgi:hypothetical protein